VSANGTAARDRRIGIVVVVVAVLLMFALTRDVGGTDCDRIVEKAKTGRLTDSDVRLHAADC
jgi:hypothetical protein